MFKNYSRLFGISGKFEGKYFDTVEEAQTYYDSLSIPIGQRCVLEYFDNYLGRQDVIRRTFLYTGKVEIMSVLDEDYIEYYDNVRSFYERRNVWVKKYGDLEKEYSAFRKRGILFSNDFYANNEALRTDFRMSLESSSRRALKRSLSWYIERK